MKTAITLFAVFFWVQLWAQPSIPQNEDWNGGSVWGKLVDDNDVDDYTERPNLILPLEFSGLEAVVMSDNQVELTWATAAEINNDYFEVQHAPNGVFWETIATISGQGYSTEPQYYRFIDLNPQAGNHHYRLKQVNFDGSYSYSMEVTVLTGIDQLPIIVMPNPVQENQTIKIENARGLENVEIYNRYGVLVLQTHQPRKRILMNFGSGVFTLRVKTNKGWTTQQILVQ